MDHTIILKTLKKTDKDLFGYNYAKKCQAPQKKQPVVVTKEQLDKIDKKFPDSYTYSIKAGSTKDKREKYYYICPKIWCPLSKISMTDAQLKKNKNICPTGENPIILKDKTWETINEKGKVIESARYPYYLTGTHPKGYDVPCCGKKDKRKDLEESNKLISIKYIKDDYKSLAFKDRYTVLPPQLSKILGNNEDCVGIVKNITNCFVKKGIDNKNNQYFILSLISLLNNNNIKTIKEFYNIFNKNINVLDYIELNNGNTMKLYINENISIYEKKNFIEFKKWISNKNNKNYIEKMNLKNMIKNLEKIEEYEYDNKNIYNNIILREFMIYNSFMNFKSYLKSNIVKTQDDILQIFLNNYEWLNPNNYNILIFNFNNVDNTKENEIIEVLCSKFINFQNRVNYSNKFIMILKSDEYYEPIIKIKLHKNDIIETKNFDYFEDIELQYIIDYQRNICNDNKLNSIINPIILYELIFTSFNNEITVKFAVINLSFKLIGYLLSNNLYIPLDSNILSTNIFRNNEIDIKKYIYIQDIINFKCSLSKKEIKDIYNLLNDNLNTNFYDIKEFIKIDDVNKGFYINNYNNDIDTDIFIPLNINKNNEELFSKHLKDELIFLGIQESDEGREYINNYSERDRIYYTKIKEIIKIINANKNYKKKIEYLKHIYNPFPLNIKLIKISDIIKKINNNLDENDIYRISEEIYIKNLSYILKKNKNELKLYLDEEVFDQTDIYNNKLEILYTLLQNPYKYIENSIEDYINYIKIPINKKYIKFSFMTNEVLSIEKPWNELLSNFNIDKSNNLNTQEYILDIFENTGKLLNIKRNTKFYLKDILNKYRISDFDKNNDTLINELKLNINFKNQYNKLKNTSNYEDISDIFNKKTYKFSYYEIRKLSEYIKINVIILGKINDNRIPNGIRCYNNYSDMYILLNIEYNKDYDKFNIIIRNNRFIFKKNEFKKEFIEYIDKYCEKKYI